MLTDVAPIRYFDREFKVETIKILPGQYYAGATPAAIATVLGSCVATCLWDPVLKIGGMNHFMLPGENWSNAGASNTSARFGIYAMEVLINEMQKQGAKRPRLVAKVFGGARVLQGFTALEVGAKNCSFVLEFLQEEGIQVVSKDLLGEYSRKIHFFPGTGKVQMKKIHILPNDTIQEREREYRAKVERGVLEGEIEMFNPYTQPIKLPKDTK